jgi:hypothetical protein
MKERRRAQQEKGGVFHIILYLHCNSVTVEKFSHVEEKDRRNREIMETRIRQVREKAEIIAREGELDREEYEIEQRFEQFNKRCTCYLFPLSEDNVFEILSYY